MALAKLYQEVTSPPLPLTPGDLSQLLSMSESAEERCQGRKDAQQSMCGSSPSRPSNPAWGLLQWVGGQGLVTLECMCLGGSLSCALSHNLSPAHFASRPLSCCSLALHASPADMEAEGSKSRKRAHLQSSEESRQWVWVGRSRSLSFHWDQVTWGPGHGTGPESPLQTCVGCVGWGLVGVIW